jgi:signal transduction histidine kinase
VSRSVLWLVPAATLVTAFVARATASDGPVVGWIVGLAIGSLAGAVVHQRATYRVQAASREVARWSGSGGYEALELDGDDSWRALATAINVTGALLSEAREELRTVVPWTERLVASLDEPAYVFGPEGRLVAYNPAAAMLSVLPPGDVATPATALGSAVMAQAVAEAVAGGVLVVVADVHAGRDLRITASPLDDHVLVVVSDRTRERQVEALRRDFVVNASHELKTPATAIAALTAALRVAPADRRDGLVCRLEEESERLVRMVHDLLDLRLLDEPEGVEQTSVDLVALVREAVDGLASTAAVTEVTFELELPPSAVVVGVARELRLVVDNLVANAVTYNRSGGEVRVTLMQDGGDQILTVADTGVGIPIGVVDRIFERFYRVDVARSRARGGTGLGLSIVRNAIERHGGRVSVASLLGVGTTFTVQLPIEPGAQ